MPISSMGPDLYLSQYNGTAETWLKDLDRYSDDEFARAPSASEWSVGQVYAHIVEGTKRFHLRMVEMCAAGAAERTEEGMNERGRTVFEANDFPPIRIAVPPSPQYTPVQPTIEAMRNGLLELNELMREAAPRAAAADPALKIPHPSFGPLNAREWYQLIPMHLRHHLLQKERIEAWLASEGT